jgi:hypothetical protein
VLELELELEQEQEQEAWVVQRWALVPHSKA